MSSKTENIQSPTEVKLIGSLEMETPEDADDGKIKMKKHMGLLEGVAIILGIIFGSGRYYYLFSRLVVVLYLFFRHFYFSERNYGRSVFSWIILDNMDAVWATINDWSNLLR